MRAPPDELADVQRCAKSPLLMLHRLSLCPSRAERRRVRGRTRARARDCSSRASWELCSRALTARAAGACLFPGWKTGAASPREQPLAAIVPMAEVLLFLLPFPLVRGSR